LLIYPQIIVAQDESGLFINLLTGNPPETSLVIKDPFGRRTGIYKFDGRDPKIVFEEIPNSSKGYEGSPGNVETDEPATTGRVYVEINRYVSSGTYLVEIYGLTNSIYEMNIDLRNSFGDFGSILLVKGYITSGTTQQYHLYIEPTPGAPAPTITKEVTFQLLRDDLTVAQKLNQIGDDKFVNSLIRMINIAEKLTEKCKKYEDKNKHKRCTPAIAVLKMFIKRLEIVNKICDNPNECKSKCKKKEDCDEDLEFNNFRKENIKDKELKDFFEEWDKDEWHKHKKMCKKFVTDEALKIISEDIEWLIKSIGVEKDKLKDKLDKD
jgi:hypothetical protein